MRFEIKTIFGFWNLESGIAAAALVLLLASCTGPQVRDRTSVNTIPSEIRQDLTVSGTITVRGEVRVFPGATLTVRPGTRFLFEPYDPDSDGVNDSRLLIEGRLEARGEPNAPIYFSSAAVEKEPGDWLEVRIDHSEGNVIEYCVLEHSRYGLHVHFSSGLVANSVFQKNIDGTRFGNSRFDLLFNRFTGNLGKGINLRASRLRIVNNVVDKNRHGIFLFEEGAGASLVSNRFSGNGLSDIRFGDFYKGALPELSANHRPDGSMLRVVGYRGDTDRLQEPYLPDEITDPSGPRIWKYRVEELWTRDLGSFVDASPVLSDDMQKVIVSTWKNGVHVLDTARGRSISSIRVPDVTDASPAFIAGYLQENSGIQPDSGTERVIFPSWDLKIRKADVRSGEVTGLVSWDPSAADDHRQASPIMVQNGGLGNSVALGLWNGQFGVMDIDSMKWQWKIQLDGAVRARAALDGRNLRVGTDGGSLYWISRDGKVHSRLALGAPIRTTPLVTGSGRVIVVTGVGVLMRINGDEISWRRKLPGSGTYASPVLLETRETNYFIVGDGSGHLSAFSQDGALMWLTDLGSPIHLVVNSDLFRGLVVGTEDGSLTGVGPLGRVRFKIQSGGAVHGAAVYADNRGSAVSKVVWGSRDGKVRSVKVSEGTTPWEPPTQ